MDLWHALESIPGQAAVLAWWRHIVGDDVAQVTPWLRPKAALARTYPRISGYGLPYEVVVHGPEHIVGVCPETGERVCLSRNDLVVWELDRHKLAGALACAFNAQPEDNGAAHDGVTIVGRLRPVAGYSFPVYWIADTGKPGVVQSLCTLGSNGSSFVVLAPSDHFVAEIQPILARTKSIGLALPEAVVVTASGEWAPTEVAATRLQTFLAEHLPRPIAVCSAFATPADARWTDVRIRFVDGHTVSVVVGATNAVLTYGDLNMADRRNGRPTKQWDLLRAFARNNGELRWSSPDAGRANQKRRDVLAKILRDFFRVPGEPIELTADGKGWRTAFAILSDNK